MNALQTESSRKTDFGKRLASSDPQLRAEAEQDLARLGSAANDVLLQELHEYEARKRSQASVYIATLSVLMNPLIQGTGWIFRWLHASLVSLILMLVIWIGIWAAMIHFLLRWLHADPERRLALCLALQDGNEQRFFGEYLLGLWEPWRTRRDTKNDPRIVAALTAQFEQHPSPPLSDATRKRLRCLFRRLYVRRRNTRQPLFAGEKDFSDAEADLLVALLRAHAKTADEDAEDDLLMVANAPATLPNRRLVRDAARALAAEPSRTGTAHYSPSAVAPPPAAAAVVPLGVRRS